MGQPDIYYDEDFKVHVEFEQEADGRWVAEVRGYPGVLAYGATCPEALVAALALLRRTIGDSLKE